MTLLARKSRTTLWLSLLLLSAPVVAGPVLHERFEPDPSEDLRLGATTPSGSMPATLQTKSGLVSAPEETQFAPQSGQQAYGGAHTPTSADAAYHIDRLTTRPDRVRYDEPFRPSILPFKRLYAFDHLKDDLSFDVGSPELDPVSVGGLAEQSEDAFFADFNVDLVANVPVRIPSVGPGARIRALHVDPPQDVEVLEDSAENWFVRAKQNGRVRMVMQLSIERQVFGSQFRPVEWAALAPFVPAVPAAVEPVAAEVAAHVGVERSDPPARALMTLVDYFRRFSESSDLPTATNALGLYRELSFEQKGVCRHRAYAFAVTALALGLPTRVVHNEAHAWVEVFDSELWHRIDLGGAATNVQETRPDPLAPNHRPPADPFTWPQGSTSGLGLASVASAAAAANAAAKLAADPSAHLDPSAQGAGDTKPGVNPAGTDDSWPGASQSTVEKDGAWGASKAVPQVVLQVGETKLLRGHPLLVSGKATKEGRVCKLSRVDIFIQGAEGERAIGSVATDPQGKFQGHVTLPPTTPVGPLQLSAQVAGGCD